MKDRAEFTLADIMSQPVCHVAPDCTVLNAAARMAEQRISCLVIMQEDRLEGIVTERDLLRLIRSHTPSETPVAQIMSTPVLTARDTMALSQGQALLQSQQMRHLVVVDASDAVAGLVSESDISNHLGTRALDDLDDLLVVMDKDLPQLCPDTPLNEALAQMWQHHSTYVLAMQDGCAVGILTERDIAHLLIGWPEAGRGARPLRDFMHSPVISVRHHTTLSEVATQMRQRRLRHMAVLDDNGLLLGMVTQHRLMQHIGAGLLREQSRRQHAALLAQAQLTEQQLHMALEAAQIGFWELDVSASQVRLSPTLKDLLGLAPHHAVSSFQHWAQQIHPQDLPRLRAKLHEKFSPAAQGMLEAEFRVRHQRGQWLWVNARGRVIQRNAHSHALRATGTLQDITPRREAQAAREATEARFQKLLNLAPLPLCHVNHEDRIVFRNDRFVRLFGYTQDDVPTLAHWWPLAYPQPETRERARQAWDALCRDARIQGGDIQATAFGITCKDGTRRAMEVAAIVLEDGILITFVDLTERMRQERQSTLERELLEQLARGEALPDLLQRLATSHETLHPGSLCTVLVLDATGQHLVHAAAPSLPDTYLQAVDGLRIGAQAHACGRAAFTRQALVCSDIASDPHWSRHRALALAHGLAACWVQPILSTQQRVLGTLAVYFSTPCTPTAQEQAELERSAHLASLAIERAQSEQSLRKLSMAVEQTPSAVIITDLQARIEYANQAFYSTTGYTPEEVIGVNPRLLQSGHTPAAAYQTLWQHLQRGDPWRGEFVNRRKNGSEYIEQVLVSPIKQDDGRITHYLAVKQDITQQKQAQADIHRLAHFDTLTGLPNRRLFTDRIQQHLSLAQRNSEQLAVMFLDLDHFKRVNDTLGHRAGDALLVALAQRLKSQLRTEDTLSRQGGDEFVLVLPGTSVASAAHVAEKLLAAVAQPVQVDGRELIPTLSIGIAMYPADGTDFDTLGKCADAAMYQAKQEGRNTHRFFTVAMQASTDRTLLLENALRHALARGELQLHYQPQISLQQGQVIGAEALLRWSHPDLGTISPAEFIPILEANGRIQEIGEWVLRQAAGQLRTWLDLGLPAIKVAVNLSAVQFRDARLPALVQELVQQSGLPHQSLELELTESLAMADPVGAASMMRDLHHHGVPIAIDDFGTGYSSLSYLKRFAAYKLKIDQSFVRDLTEDADDKAIVRAIIGLATSLGMKTIAEGVETPGQLDFLRAQGCDEAQGYFFGKPMPPEQFQHYVSSQSLH